MSTHPSSTPPAGDLPGAAEALRRHAARAPDGPAYIDGAGTVSYGALAGAMGRGAAWLAARGVRAGDTVAMALDASPAGARRALELFYGLTWLGAPMLPVYPDTPPQARVALLRRFGARWLLASGAPARVEQAQSIDPTAFDPAGAGLDAASAPRGDAPEAILFYLFTSGTTGEAKALPHTNREMAYRAAATNRAQGIDADDRVLSSVPWPSGVCLRWLLRAHAAGAALVSAAMGDTRERFGEVLARHGVTRVMASPWQMRRLLLSPPPARVLPPLRSFTVAGAMVSPDEIASARAGLTPEVRVDYGSNETGPIALLPPGIETTHPGSVGPLLPGVEVRIEDEQGRELPPGGIGALGFRTPGMGQGYAGQAGAGGGRFRGGWFFPGDVGGIAADGHLFLCGRVEDVVNAGGLKIFPAEIEAVLRRHPGVLDAAVAGVPHPQAGELPVAFVVPRPVVFLQATPAGLQAFCAERLERARLPLAILLVDRIPRNEAGKILRDQLVAGHPYVGELVREAR